MTQATAPIWASIFIAGFVAGMLVGIGIKMGITPDEIGIGTEIVKQVCTSINEINNSVSYNCTMYLVAMIFLSVFLAIGSAFEEAFRMNNWKIGLGIYIFGWLIGIMYILFFS